MKGRAGGAGVGVGVLTAAFSGRRTRALCLARPGLLGRRLGARTEGGIAAAEGDRRV